MRSLRSCWAWLVFAVLLGSCGGGGVDGGDPPLPTSPRLLTLVAGTLDEGGVGSADGTGAAARFSASDITLAPNGNVYVADSGNGTIRRVTPSGVVTTVLGRAGTQARVDGPGADVLFSHPQLIAAAADGSLYVLEAPPEFGAPYTLRWVRADGSVTTLLNLEGPSRPGDNRYGPMALDADGRLHVADMQRCELRRIDPARFVVETVASFPFIDESYCTLGPQVRADSHGDIYYAEGDFSKVASRVLKKRSAAGVVTTVIDQPVPIRAFVVRRDGAVVFYDDGVIYAVPAGDNTALRLSGFGQTSDSQLSDDGDATTARFYGIAAMVADADNNVLMLSNGTVRRLAPDGRATTIAGLAPQAGLYRTGTGDQARIGYEADLVADRAGNAYLSGASFQVRAIARITPQGVVSTFVGSIAERGRLDAAGTAARFEVIRTLTRDPLGALFVAEARDVVTCGRYGLTSKSVLRKVDADGNVRTLPYVFDGDIAQIASLAGGKVLVMGSRHLADCGSEAKSVAVAMDGSETAFAGLPDGKVFGDGTDTTYVIVSNAIRKRLRDGQVLLLAGSETEPGDQDGVGAAARFRAPGGLDVDAAGNVYVADTGNSTIRKISPDGSVTTVVGRAGLHGIRLGELPAGLDYPSAVAVVPQGLLIRSRLALLRAPL